MLNDIAETQNCKQNSIINFLRNNCALYVSVKAEFILSVLAIRCKRLRVHSHWERIKQNNASLQGKIY